MTREAILEGILFAMGGSVEREQLAEAMEVTPEEVEAAAAALKAKYEEEDRGIRLIRLDSAYQLCSAEGCYDTLIRLASKPKQPVLTDVVRETLAIIAYKQPVTKGDIERIRGVSSDHAVNRLVEFGLVEEKGRLNAPGRPILFGTTEAGRDRSAGGKRDGEGGSRRARRTGKDTGGDLSPCSCRRGWKN